MCKIFNSGQWEKGWGKSERLDCEGIRLVKETFQALQHKNDKLCDIVKMTYEDLFLLKASSCIKRSYPSGMFSSRKKSRECFKLSIKRKYYDAQ